MAKASSKPTEDQGDAPAWAVSQEDMTVAKAATDADVQAYTVPSTGEVIPMGPASMALIEWCASMVTEDDNSTAAAMEAMIAAVMNSDTPDEVLAERMTVPVEKVLGIPVQINGVRMAHTDMADGFPFYALLDVQYGQGMRPHVISIGAFKVMAQLYGLSKLAEWPQVVVFKKSDRPTKAGFYPISMVRPL